MRTELPANDRRKLAKAETLEQAGIPERTARDYEELAGGHEEQVQEVTMQEKSSLKQEEHPYLLRFHEKNFTSLFFQSARLSAWLIGTFPNTFYT
jgi:hypothetical protein